MKYISEDDAEKLYNEYLDEVNPIIVINGAEFLPSTVLRECDPIAYDCWFADWLDSENLTTTEDEADEEEENDNA